MIHKMNLWNDSFISIKNKTKTIEMRLNDEKRSKIKIGDIIEFTNTTTLETLNVKVDNIFKYDDFEQLYSHHDKISIGYKEDEVADPKDMLTTGVEIVASRPGKKLTTISLLSGGEKTLTAISLLFAILNVRSVPFCLFDEVEAALDEANVSGFGKYLNHYRDKTQFLIITHKKKTMEYANTLYGITMQESGVSKLVSVKLTDREELV